MERHFQGSVRKNNNSDNIFGTMSDIQDSDDLVIGEPPLDQLDVDAGALSIKFYDGDTGEETEPVDGTAPAHDAPSSEGGVGGILGDNFSYFDTTLKQYNPRSEFHKLGDQKLVQMLNPNNSKLKWFKHFFWRIQTKNGRPDLRSITVKQNGKNVTYTFAYCDWVYEYSDSR